MVPSYESSPRMAFRMVDFPEPIGPAIIVIVDVSNRRVRLVIAGSEAADGRTVIFSIEIAAVRSMRVAWTS